MSLPRLYAILDVEVAVARGWCPADVCDVWLAAGIRLIQLRAKGLSLGPFLVLADDLQRRCAEAGARLVINDRADVAALSQAAGVHVGQDDLTPADVRKVVGSAALVGLSTHQDDQIQAAVRQSVSYVAIGPVFGTRTKETGYAPVGLEQVSRAAHLVHEAGLPLVAIGGIDVERSADVLAAGADSVAVISALFDGADVRALHRCARQWVEQTVD